MPVMPAARPVPPIQPDLDDCCNSGCNPCIFDLYQDALERYRADLKAWEEGVAAAAQKPAPRRKAGPRNAG
jgi:hypothetical protein